MEEEMKINWKRIMNTLDRKYSLNDSFLGYVLLENRYDFDWKEVLTKEMRS